MPGLVNSGAVKLDPSDVSFYQPSYQLLKASPNTPVLGVSFSSLIVIVRGIVNLSSPPVNLEVNPTRRCKIKYARGVSREHIRNFPVKSVKFANSKDFRCQDFKDFTKISETNYEISSLLRTPRANHTRPFFRAGAYTASDSALREKSGLATRD